MFRTRLVGVALLVLCFLPGCGLFWGDRPGLCCRPSDRYGAMPVSFPGADPGCGATVIPPGPGPYGAPIYGAPGATIPSETFPPPYGTIPPRIPKAGIDDGRGKQFELESGRGTGPVLTIPATGVKGN